MQNEDGRKRLIKDAIWNHAHGVSLLALLELDDVHLKERLRRVVDELVACADYGCLKEE